MHNTVSLIGNLGADPEVFYSPSSGDPVGRFNLAFVSGKDKTSWIKVVCFNRLATVAEKYLHKGARIAVNGILDQNTWETEAWRAAQQHAAHCPQPRIYQDRRQRL